ncbi:MULTISPECIES: pro-sigmaK processing inhibitor BofA family protein [unclassified Bacillus (in: firmicutes)]|uniref:pro-sigmaK processing inhibitor BofA family protein n=1 Tax=unclassified Bacillus (in: firmicutes) TaxID=185979 RepID=UPI000BEF9698|nr:MULTISPECIES: pro-sigmaK processing inhibitor BofA family protein [unclassified Bacillus (in: firmicutes)]PEJ51886.1 transcriptional regulator [Bacillus sp. AFS002410]
MNSIIMISVGLFVILFLFLVGLPVKALKKISKYVLRGIVCVMIVFILNYALATNNFHIPINSVTCAFLSIVGVPGIVALSVIGIYLV